jgi:hypothetical protein
MENSKKRRRIEINNNSKIIVNIIEVNNRKWLVEWNDKSRSWEKYEKLKDLEIFKEYIFKCCKKLSTPSYIV